jgi:hypothetical protein
MKKVPIRSMFPTGPVKNGLYIRIKKVSLHMLEKNLLFEVAGHTVPEEREHVMSC